MSHEAGADLTDAAARLAGIADALGESDWCDELRRVGAVPIPPDGPPTWGQVAMTGLEVVEGLATAGRLGRRTPPGGVSGGLLHPACASNCTGWPASRFEGLALAARGRDREDLDEHAELIRALFGADADHVTKAGLMSEPDPAAAGPRFRQGRLLVAAPTLMDPQFQRAVVVLLEHTDDGALGLVLNQPTEIQAADALPEPLCDLVPPGTGDPLRGSGAARGGHHPGRVRRRRIVRPGLSSTGSASSIPRRPSTTWPNTSADCASSAATRGGPRASSRVRSPKARGSMCPRRPRTSSPRRPSACGVLPSNARAACSAWSHACPRTRRVN